MLSTLCTIWDRFRDWVTNGWTDTTFVLVIVGLGILGVMGVLTFLKKTKPEKEKKPIKWSGIVLSIVMFGLMIVLFLAKY